MSPFWVLMKYLFLPKIKKDKKLSIYMIFNSLFDAVCFQLKHFDEKILWVFRFHSFGQVHFLLSIGSFTLLHMGLREVGLLLFFLYFVFVVVVGMRIFCLYKYIKKQKHQASAH